MPWVWHCLYEMKVYIAQAFRVGYVFYGHLWLPNKFILACYLGKAGSLVGKLH